ncbi:hypothetical protein GF312_12965, partial [Candidatus Poribacteria bacterium]|nr:hypothetical protein [Candidatus Poribacteria bacterium]
MCIFVCLLLFASFTCADTEINSIESLKLQIHKDNSAKSEAQNLVSGLDALYEPSSMLVAQIQGQKHIEYNWGFVNAEGEKPLRFYVDIIKSQININSSDIDYIPPDSGNISIIKDKDELFESDYSPVSRIVIAQFSSTPPVVRVVFYMKDWVEPDLQSSGNSLLVRFRLIDSSISDISFLGGPMIMDSPDEIQSEIPEEKSELTVEDSIPEEPIQDNENIEKPEDLITDEPEYTVQNPETTEFTSDDILTRPAIIETISPDFRSKVTRLEIISDRQLSIKQIRLSQSGVLSIEILNAQTSLPDSISIDKGIIRSIAFDSIGSDLNIYISLTQPVIYDVESSEEGLIVVFQNPVLEQLVTINADNESLSTVLLMLFTQYGANIVAGSNV